MPIHADIEAGAYDPADAASVTAESLAEAVEAAHSLVEEIKAVQYEIRDNTGKRFVLEALAESDAELIVAIDAANQAGRVYGRFVGSGPGQTVAVGTAQDGEEAGS